MKETSPTLMVILALFAIGAFAPVFFDATDEDGELGWTSYLLLFGALVVLAVVLLAEVDIFKKVSDAYTQVLGALLGFVKPVLSVVGL